MTQERILLVDDEVEFRERLAKKLEKHGYKVTAVGGGAEAIEKVKEKSFDVIFLDMVMPGMDGMETLSEIKKINEDLQVILLTGFASIEKGVEAVKLGALDFLEKPASMGELEKKIEEAAMKRIALVEKHSEDKIVDILKSKSW